MNRATAEQASNENEGTDFDKFMHLITHDVRASLRALSSLPEWIREDLEPQANDIPADVFRHLDMLERHACRADRLLLDLRDYAQAGSDPTGCMPISFRDAFEKTLVISDLPPDFDVTASTADVPIMVPTDELVQLLVALISNAAKHHDKPTGQVQVSVCAAKGKICVLDDGPGIAPKFREKVFEPLSTLRPRDEVEGSGIGLALARKIVTAWGGDIQIAEPLTPRGTLVEIVVPSAFESNA